jgi:predicted dienelactone hydrolase
MLNLVQHCLAQGEADLGFCYNGMPDPAAQAARRAQFEAARGVPERFLPATLTQLHGGRSPGPDGDDPRPDPRVASVSLAVPVAAIFSAESLARIRVPVGLVSAGRDTMLVPAFHSGLLLRACGSCTLLADLPGAAHMDLLAPFPASLAREAAARQARGGMPAPGFDPQARAAAFQAIADFHRRHLGP